MGFVETSRWGNLFVRAIPSGKRNILLLAARGKCAAAGKGKSTTTKKKILFGKREEKY